MGLPIVGNLYSLSSEPYKDFMELRKKYGDMFTINYGPFRTVIINDYKLIKEALRLNELQGRPNFLAFKQRNNGESAGKHISWFST